MTNTPKSEHGRVILNAAQKAQFQECKQAIDEHVGRLDALLGSAFRSAHEPKNITPFVIAMVPTGDVDTCPRCLFMAIHMMRETADLFEDVARKLELKEPAFDEWQRPASK